MVYSGLYPTHADDFEDLRDALDKFRLNDSSLFYQPETSAALGFGFRCGFFGMLAYGNCAGTTLENIINQLLQLFQMLNITL